MIGILSKLYVNTGTYATPIWLEVDLIGDLAVNGTWNEGEATTRTTRLQLFEPTTMALALDGNVRVKYDDPGYQELRDCFIEDVPMDVMALNAAHTVNGAEGFRFDAKVFNWSEDQGRGTVLFKQISIKPCTGVNDPKYVIVAAGVPTFTAIGDQVVP